MRVSKTNPPKPPKPPAAEMPAGAVATGRPIRPPPSKPPDTADSPTSVPLPTHRPMHARAYGAPWRQADRWTEQRGNPTAPACSAISAREPWQAGHNGRRDLFGPSLHRLARLTVAEHDTLCPRFGHLDARRPLPGPGRGGLGAGGAGV